MGEDVELQRVQDRDAAVGQVGVAQPLVGELADGAPGRPRRKTMGQQEA
jgi:hypothetical protein